MLAGSVDATRNNAVHGGGVEYAFDLLEAGVHQDIIDANGRGRVARHWHKAHTFQLTEHAVALVVDDLLAQFRGRLLREL